MSDIKTAIITGAGSGIGAAAAERFAADGYALVINSRTAADLEKVRDGIGNDRTVIFEGDVSDEDTVKGLIDCAIDRFGRLDTLVNNAGIAVPGPIEEVSPEDWDKQQAVNGRSMYLTIRAALPHLEKTKGSVVNTSSVSGLGGDWGMFAYNASKGMVSNLTRALALDFGRKGVRINAVAPSVTRTEMAQGIMDDDALYEKFMERVPLGRPAEPRDIADVIAFLASDDARFVTGVVLPVDGGVSASNGQPPLG